MALKRIAGFADNESAWRRMMGGRDEDGEPGSLRCLVCRAPMARSLPLRAALKVADEVAVRPGPLSPSRSREVRRKAREIAYVIGRKKRRDAVTCSPSCRVTLSRLRRMKDEDCQAYLLRRWTREEGR